MKLIEAMREAVAERGADWTYPNHETGGGETNWHYEYSECRYVTRDEKEGACLIGVALLKMGYKPEEIDALESANTLLHRLGDFDEVEVDAAAEAQVAQDAGVNWGYALEAAEEVLKDA